MQGYVVKMSRKGNCKLKLETETKLKLKLETEA